MEIQGKEFNVPWLSEDGHLDYSKYPIEHLTRDALSDDRLTFQNACRLLGSMSRHGRDDAAIFLFGLVSYYKSDIKRLEVIVENLRGFKTEKCANFLFEEIERVESNNTTRNYIKIILNILKYFPPDLVLDKFFWLSEDKKFSYKMRKHFLAIIDEIEYRE